MKTPDVGHLEGRTVFVTGGTGSFGRAFVRRCLDLNVADKLICFSRDEQKQLRMQREFDRPDKLAFRLGDVRDAERLETALWGADTIVHAAALKVITQGLDNPDELLKTNCLGTLNILFAIPGMFLST